MHKVPLPRHGKHLFCSRKCSMPSRRAAQWFRNLFARFIWSRVPVIMSGSGDVMSLIQSGERELLDSAISPGELCVRSHFAPRKLLVYLLFTDSELYHCVQQKYLDAFADMYSAREKGLLPSASPEVGGAVLAGDDSVLFCSHANTTLQSHRCNADSECNVCVAFRWAHEGKVLTRFQKMPYVATQQLANLQLQNALASLSSVEHVCIPASCWVAPERQSRVFSDVFANVCTEFVQSMECEPSLTLQTQNTLLEPTGVFVRVVPKNASVASDACFHGVILCQLGKSDCVRSLCGDLERSNNRIEIHEMFSEEIRAQGMHLCAVQAERVAVLGLQEQYCTWESASQSSGDMEIPFLVQRAVAVRPIDELLVASFDIYPCRAQNCFPGQVCLRSSFKSFFDVCNHMARSAVGQKEIPARFHGSSIACEEGVCSDTQPTTNSTEVPSAETTIGAAAAYFLKRPAEVQFGLVLLQCAGVLGIGATVRRAVSHVWQVLRDVDKTDSRLRATVEAADSRHSGSVQTLQESPKNWVGQILELQGLAISKGDKCICDGFLNAETAATKLLAFLIQMETGKRPEPRHMQSASMQQVVKSGFRCDVDSVQKNSPRAAVECAVVSFQSEFGGFRNTNGARSVHPVFLLETKNSSPHVRIMRQSAHGGFQDCNLTQFANARSPTVVIVNFSDKRKRKTTIRLARSKRKCDRDPHPSSPRSQ